ncbi:MAG: hypothetical protein RL227_777, partial [Pseudomonadota bacterium]
MSRAPWWSRLFGQPAQAPTVAAAPPGPGKVRLPSGAAAELPAGALRRPLIGRDGQVAAFEWLLADAARRPLADHQALWAAAAAASWPALVTLPARRARDSAGPAALTPGRWLQLDELPDAALAAELRA